jgi:hypothetical protein
MPKLLAFAFIVLVAFSVNAQKVQVGADPGVDLTKFKTYNWAPGPIVANPVISKMIVDTVDAAMTAKGLRKVETDPEMTVVAFGAIDSDMHASYPSWMPALNSINTGIVSNTQTWPISKGTLVVEMQDTKTKNSLWRGQSVQTLDHGPTGDREKDAKTVAKPIKKAIDKMFKQYPVPNRK